MDKRVRGRKPGDDALELSPVAARFARGWVIFFVVAALCLLVSMWARAHAASSAADAAPGARTTAAADATQTSPAAGFRLRQAVLSWMIRGGA
jgi:hypothetical protein